MLVGCTHCAAAASEALASSSSCDPLLQAVFTLLPLRVGLALLALWRTLLGSHEDSSSSSATTTTTGNPTAAEQQPSGGTPSQAGKRVSKGNQQHQQGQARHGKQQQSGEQAQQARQAGQPTRRRRARLRGDQLFDLLCAVMSLGVVLFLWNLNAGTLYFWMKVGPVGGSACTDFKQAFHGRSSAHGACACCARCRQYAGCYIEG